LTPAELLLLLHATPSTHESVVAVATWLLLLLQLQLACHSL
jgi:hypothetical protein